MKIIKGVLFLLFSCYGFYGYSQSAINMPVKNMLLNGTIFTDTQGNKVHAHGGGFLKSGGCYYWIGENRQNNNLVACYRSLDLINWEFRGNLLSRNSAPELESANIERPKVIYNEETKMFVMWMHYELRRDYSVARCAVASSVNIEGPYTYLGSFRPEDNMSRDCNLFKDSDGKAYFISTTRNNLDMNVYELTPDYLHVKSKIATLWPGAMREAPAVVKKGDYYLMMTSYCTGWKPNQGKYAYSRSMAGPWSLFHNFGSPTTFDTQPTCILPIEGAQSTSYLYVADRWDPAEYPNSSYVFLPIIFKNDTTLEVNWVSSLSVNCIKGTFTTKINSPQYCRIKYRLSDNYLSPQPDGTIGYKGLSYKLQTLKWILSEDKEGYVRIKNQESGKFLDAKNEEAKVVLADSLNLDSQLWKLKTNQEGWSCFINKLTRKALQMERSQQQPEYLIQSAEIEDVNRKGKQQFLIAWEYQ
ncbi:MAG: family 43 glycosylhydrolase [Bacteroidota bacterium]|nr:family 43 glycosylhydrolase [Bacteroidota bacterium]